MLTERPGTSWLAYKMVHVSLDTRLGINRGCCLPAETLNQVHTHTCQEDLRYRKIWCVPCGPGAASEGR